MNHAERAARGRGRARARRPTRPTSSRSAATRAPRAALAAGRRRRPTRVTFRYDGLDGMRRSTHLAFSRAGAGRRAGRREVAGSAIRGLRSACAGRWHLGERRRRASWSRGSAGATHRPAASAPADRAPPDDRRRRCSRDPPRVTSRRGRGRLPRVGAAGTTADPHRPRAVQPDDRAVASADLRLLVNDGPAPGRALRRRRRARGSRRCSGATRSSPRSSRSPFRPADRGRDARGPRRAPGDRGRRLARRRAGQDPPRAADRRDGRATASCPITPYYGSVDSTPLWLILLGATFDWTGDRALVDRLWPNALAGARLDRPLRRPRRRRLRRVRAAVAARPAQPGLEGLRRRDPRPRRAGSPDDARSRSPRSRATSSTRSGGWRASPGCAARTTLATRLDAEAETLRAAVRGARSGSRTSATTRWRSTARSASSTRSGSNAGQCLWSGIVAPDRAARRRRPAAWRRRCSRGWGIRTYAAGQPGYNPIGYHTGTVWPHDTSLIAAGLQALRLPRRGEPARAAAIFEARQHFAEYRLPELFCGFDRDVSAVPVPYPVACSPQAWAAGSVVPVPRDDARAAAARRGGRAGARATRTCRTGSAR